MGYSPWDCRELGTAEQLTLTYRWVRQGGDPRLTQNPGWMEPGPVGLLGRGESRSTQRWFGWAEGRPGVPARVRWRASPTPAWAPPAQEPRPQAPRAPDGRS